MTKYNGHKNWNHWNVSLWISNDEGLYRLAQACIRDNMSRTHSDRDQAARDLLAQLPKKTPDGAPCTSLRTARSTSRVRRSTATSPAC